MEGGASNAVEEVLWWFAWHRLHVLLGGISVALLAGYTAGSLGLGIVVVGFLLVLLGSLSQKALAVEILSFASVAALLYSFEFEEVLSWVGISPEVAGTLAEFVLGISSDIGFRTDYPAGQALSTVGDAVTGLATWMLIGFTVGLFSWGMGALVVNRTHGDVYDSYRMLIEKKGEALLGEEAYTATNGVGSVLGLKPNKEYHASNIRVRDNSVDINYGSVLSMPSKAVSVSASTKQMYYDQLASVEYKQPHLEIRMSDGDIVRIATSEKPAELLEEIETTLKNYKRLTTPSEDKKGYEPEPEPEPEPETEPTGKAPGTAEPDSGQPGIGSDAGSSPSQEPSVDDESKARAEEAVEDIEEVVESAFDEMGGPLTVMGDDEEMDVEEKQVEVEEGASTSP